jgi:hypothetical protein
MRFTKLHLLQMLACLACAAMAGLVGWTEGAKTVLKNDAALCLAENVTNYKLLEEGKIDHVKSNLGFRIINNIQSYDSFQKEDPNFGVKNKIPTSMVAEGREIAAEAEKHLLTAPTDTK